MPDVPDLSGSIPVERINEELTDEQVQAIDDGLADALGVPRASDAATRPERVLLDVLEGDGYTTDPEFAHVPAALDELVAERDALNMVAEAARRLYNSGEYSDERLWPQLGHALDTLDGTRKLRAES